MTAGALLSAALLLVVWSQSRGGVTSPGWQTYHDAKYGFSISYPNGWNADFRHISVGFLSEPNEKPGQPHDKHTYLVTIGVPAHLTKGTNLSDDTRLDVATHSDFACSPTAVLYNPGTVHRLTENGITYSVASVGEGAAGNFYETTVFVIEGSKPCLVVEYFIHSTNIGAYDPGTVREFDHAALVADFDRIRRTLVVRPPAPTPAGPR